MGGSAAFQEVLLQAIDDGLLVPGEIVRAAIHDRVERSCQIRGEDIPEKLELFHNAPRDLLAAAGEVLDRLIAKNLHLRLGLNFNQHENWALLDHVDEARKAHK
jgi:adenylate kinase family enzyme